MLNYSDLSGGCFPPDSMFDASPFDPFDPLRDSWVFHAGAGPHFGAGGELTAPAVHFGHSVGDTIWHDNQTGTYIGPNSNQRTYDGGATWDTI